MTPESTILKSDPYLFGFPITVALLMPCQVGTEEE
jgi:hypothetical protein